MEHVFAAMFAFGLVVGAAMASLWWRGRAAALSTAAIHAAADSRTTTEELSRLRAQLTEATTSEARLEAALEHERRASAEKLAVLDGAQQKLADTVSALSSQALDRNSRALLDLAAASFQPR